MEFIKFIGVACFTFLFVTAEPIEKIKDKLCITGLLRNLLDCALCSGFWIGIFVYQDIFIASIVACCAELIYRLFSN